MSFKSLVPLLNVQDVAVSLRFYCDSLGFTVVSSHEESERPIWARIERDGVQLMLNEQAGISAEDRVGRGSYADVVLYVAVDNVATLHARLIVDGYDPGPLTRQEYGFDDFVLRDPDGYELSFGSPVSDV